MKVKEINRNGKLRRHYGLTPEGLDDLIQKQDNRCAICCIELSRDNRSGNCYSVDHKHEEKGLESVRAILCAKCNKGLGLFNDDHELLEQAAEYIREYL